MSPWFYVGFPLLMMVLPAVAVASWCMLTGVRGALPILAATLVALVGFGVSAYYGNPEHPLHYNLWGTGAFLVLFFGFGLPIILRAFRELPTETPRSASLKPRKLEMFRGAFVWPFFAWVAIVGSLFLVDVSPVAWVCPALGLFGLLILKPCLKLSAREPEPLGGPDPDALAERWAAFRRRRTNIMYWMCVFMALLASSGWMLALGERAATWIGGTLGPLIGIFGGFFGVWADAQRYNLRRQLSGAEPL